MKEKMTLEEESYSQPFPLKRKGNRFALQSRYLKGKGVKKNGRRIDFRFTIYDLRKKISVFLPAKPKHCEGWRFLFPNPGTKASAFEENDRYLQYFCTLHFFLILTLNFHFIKFGFALMIKL